MRVVIVLFLLLTVLDANPGLAQNTASTAAFEIKNFGAVGDGKALDHAAINRAIDAAHSAGGGTVHVPAGTYLCFSIHLQSNVTLQFEPGATIVAADSSTDGGRYDAAEPNAADPYEDFGHSHFHNSLIWGENLANVAIVGPGLIHGRGLSDGTRGTMAESAGPAAGSQPAATAVPQPGATPKPKFGFPNPGDTLRDGIGNKAIALKNCRGVTLRDFSVLHGGHFAILATGVDNLAIDNVKLDTHRDGMDIDNCRNVRITDCSVNSPWDDGICLKSSYALGTARGTENVTISGCYLAGDYCEGTMLDGTWQHIAPGEKLLHMGRIKFGTESNGGFRRIAITNCIFDHCKGLAIESVDGAIVEDVVVNNLAMHDIVGSPIFIRLGSRLRGPEGTVVGAIRRVIINNVTVSGAEGRYGSILSGIPGHPLQDIQISNVRGVEGGGGTEQDAGRQPPENATGYPDPDMFGTMPSWGFYVRHCEGLELQGVGLQTAKPDQRPCVVLDDVTGADFDRLQAPPRAKGQTLFRLRGVREFTARHCAGLPDTYRATDEDEAF